MHRFSSDAQQSLTFAQQEAERLEHDYIGTEHLLLGLLDVQDCSAAQVLALFRVDADMARHRIQTILQTHSRVSPVNITIALGRLGVITVTHHQGIKRTSDEYKLTRRVQKCIHHAVEKAERVHAEKIDTEHLLSGILHEGEGLACKVLTSLNVDIEALKKSIE